MEVDVQLETAAEALDHRDGAGLAVRDAESSRRARVEGEQCPGIHAQHRATQGVIPGQAVAQAIGQREHPLAHRHPRQQVVDEGGRVLRHPPPPQLEQKPRRLHEKGTSRSNAHSGHRSRVKPSARIPQRRKSRNSCSTKEGRPLPSARSETSRRKGSRCSRMMAWSTECSVSRGRYGGWGCATPWRSACREWRQWPEMETRRQYLGPSRCRSSTTSLCRRPGGFVPCGSSGWCGLRVLVASHVSGSGKVEAVERYGENVVVAETVLTGCERVERWRNLICQEPAT